MAVADPDHSDRALAGKHLFYASDNLRLCVSSCPDVAVAIKKCKLFPSDCKSNGVCMDGYKALGGEVNDTLYGTNSEGCPEYMYDTVSIPFLERCAPNVVGRVGEDFAGAVADISRYYYGAVNADEHMETFIASFVEAGPIIGALCGIAVGLSFFCIGSMKYFGGPIIYLTILTALLLLWGITISLGVLTKKEYDEYQDTNVTEREDSEELEYQVLFGTFLVVGIFAVIFSCILISSRKKIATAIELLEEAAAALFSMPTVFAIPVLGLVGVIVWGVVWSVIMAHVASSQDLILTSDGFVDYDVGDTMVFSFVYMLFALFWISELINAIQQFLIASCVALWYINERDPTLPVWTSIYRAFRYHFGSLAFGAAVVAIIQTARAAVEYARQKVESKTPEEAKALNCLIKIVFCCLQCILWCCEKCVRFINKAAYVEIAVWGRSFCTSAFNGLSLLTDNVMLIAIISGATYLVCAVIKLFVIAGTGIIAYWWLEQKSDEVPAYPAVVIVVAIFAYVIVTSFTETYDMAGEAMTIVFLEDYKANGKNADREMLAPEGLKNLMVGNKKKSESGGSEQTTGGGFGF